MTDVATPTAEPLLTRTCWLRQLPMALALVALADWLFYRHAIGISAALFLLALGGGAALANPLYATRREVLIASGVLAVAIAPLVVETSLLSVLSGALGTAYFTLALTRAGADWMDRIRSSIALLLDTVWQATADIGRGGVSWASGDATSRRLSRLVVWIVPLGASSVFLLLFVSANPLIEDWFAKLDFRSQAAQLSFARIGFWLIALSMAWPFVFMRDRSPLQHHAETEFRAAWESRPDAEPAGLLFGQAAILRSLLVFNALFALQTTLDITYLWGGVALPDGMTYASYAHRGAYPLIVTALLAAAFVIVATQPGSGAERSPLIRKLVFLWIGQNVLLVISSILRLDLYVEAYSLTYLRVAAFVWMLLVAVGLVLIVARIALGRSNAWLVGMNLASLALTLYVCSYVNFPRMIADYNVAHSRDVSGRGMVVVDVAYLASLGPQAIPALDRYFAHRGSDVPAPVIVQRHTMAAVHITRMQDWRAWTYRDWELERYLRNSALQQ